MPHNFNTLLEETVQMWGRMGPNYSVSRCPGIQCDLEAALPHLAMVSSRPHNADLLNTLPGRRCGSPAALPRRRNALPVNLIRIAEARSFAAPKVAVGGVPGMTGRRSCMSGVAVGPKPDRGRVSWARGSAVRPMRLSIWEHAVGLMVS